MALSIELPNNDDGTLDYWRITEEQRDHDAGLVLYTIAGYRSAEARKAGRRPLAQITGALSPATIGKTTHTVETADLYAHAARPSDPVICTQEMVNAGHYAPELLGQPVMPQAAPNPLAGAASC
ncbi:hypothetical protein UFOVP99_25 [uncultured Caudovirales phage]|uniref:Uncharacterized protein n=1 Tax=uncultured Caudovirales phage TaxID=2100421 RepID=A0A6J5L6Q8_9CAUD|nr:hypothetical protein UFOVP99_25 [uncultured Caudovirales phage]